MEHTVLAGGQQEQGHEIVHQDQGEHLQQLNGNEHDTFFGFRSPNP